MLYTFEDEGHFVSLPLKRREKIKTTMTYHTLFYYLWFGHKIGFGKLHTERETVQLAFTFLMGLK